MVTEMLPQEADQVPAETPVEEVQETEIPEPEAPVEDAAPAEEAAVEAPPEPQERVYTEAEALEFAQRAAAEAAERDRRLRQAENAYRAQQQQREQEERQELADTLSAALVKAGMPEVDPDAVQPILDRAFKRREGQMFTRAESAIDTAFQYIAAPVLGEEEPFLSPEAARLAARMQPHFQRLLDAVVPAVQGMATEGYVPKSELPKYVKAEIEAQNARARQNSQPIQRPEGTASPNRDDSYMARVNRIISGDADEADKEWWFNQGPGRKAR